MIEFSHVYKTYDGPVHALKNVNIVIEKGDYIYITGPSGAGKTTLFRLMSAYDKPSSGNIQIAGHYLDKISDKQIPDFRRKIGVVFQDFKLLSDYSIFENIALPLRVRGLKNQFVVQRTHEVLEMVGLENRQHFLPVQLSGGEKQRTAIARALVHQPEVLIADEPTGNLDPELSEEIINLFEQVNLHGTTVLVATHDHNLVKRSGKKRIHLQNGMVGPIEC